MTAARTPFRFRPVHGLIGMVCVAILAGLAALPRVEGYFLERLRQESDATLSVVAEGLDQALIRFEPLPELIAERQSLLHVLREPGNSGLIPFVNEQLRLTAASVGASDVYLMDLTGRTIAASNYRKDSSFIGKNFSFRPYFQEAATGRSSLFHALGTTSGERGFFFASPVLDGVSIEGVIAVKITVDMIEATWNRLSEHIAVADPNGILFLSSRPEWRFRSLVPLSSAVRDQIETTQQFPLDRVAPINASTRVISEDAVAISLDGAAGRENLIVESVPLALPGWHIIAFSPATAARQSALNAFVIWMLGVSLLSLTAYVIVQRRARREEMARIQHGERRLLEQRVEERTADLKLVNAELESEVEERTAAEIRLKKAQSELVQAGKLAALGQMSAAISHEINQPLSAMLSYADNAVAYLDRDRVAEARANVERISTMADRMARISSHLRNFARRPGDTLKAVELNTVIEEAIAIVEPRAKAASATMAFERAEDIFAMGGQLRLQQVLLNLFNNALDAMDGQAAPQIDVWIEAAGETLDICVHDHGPGLSPDMVEQAFEPFVSTKDVGEGIGLGLSISFNIIEDFGGKLSCANHSDGGALFRVSLQPAVDMQVAGQ